MAGPPQLYLRLCQKNALKSFCIQNQKKYIRHRGLLKTFKDKSSGRMMVNAILPLVFRSFKWFSSVSGGGAEGAGVHAGGAGGGWQGAAGTPRLPACRPSTGHATLLLPSPLMPPPTSHPNPPLYSYWPPNLSGSTECVQRCPKHT